MRSELLIARGATAPRPRARVSAGWRDAGITVIALLCLLAWDASGADLRVVQWFGSADGFRWRDHWLTAQVLHAGGRWISLALLIGVMVNAVRPFRPARRLPRAVRLWWLLTTVACLLLIPYLKSRSHISCPWDLAQFGGSARWLSHADWRAWTAPGDGGPGRCFPSGHASGAFAFLAGWFALRGTAPRAARAWLVAVVVLGLLFGLAQTARGAHYPSHTLWTAWICWAASVAAWHGARRAGLMRGH